MTRAICSGSKQAKPHPVCYRCCLFILFLGYPIIWDSDASVSREGNMIRSSVGIDFTSLVGNTIMFDCPIINTEPMSVVWTKNGNSVLGTNVEVQDNLELCSRLLYLSYKRGYLGRLGPRVLIYLCNNSI